MKIIDILTTYFDQLLSPLKSFHLLLNYRHFNLRRTVMSVLLVSLISGCSSFTAPSNSKSTQPRYMTLMPVPDDLVGESWLEKFTFDGVVERSMLVQTELTAQGINLVAMSFEGIPLLQASYRDATREIVTETSLNVGLDPYQVFHDLQSVNWPIEQVRANLLANIKVSEKPSAEGTDSKIRYYHRQQRLVRQIEYKNNTVTVNDLEHNYILNIIRLEDSH